MSWRLITRDHKHNRTELLETVLLGAASSKNNSEHFKMCKSCASEAKELSSLLNLLDEWQCPEPSPYFDTRLRARLRAERDAPKPLWEVVRRARLGWQFAVVIVLAGFLIVFGLFVGSPRPLSTPSPNGDSAVLDLQSLDRDSDLLSEINWLESGDAATPRQIDEESR